MPIYNIPFDNSLKYQKKTLLLDGETFIFEFTYNQRCDTWHFNVLNSDRTPIVNSHPLVLGANLLEYVSGPKPKGIVALYALGERKEVITGDMIGQDVLLIYGTTEA